MAPFPQLVPLRTRGLLERLESSIWHDPQPVQVERGPLTAAFSPWPAARRQHLVPMRPGSRWGRLFQHTWFRVRGLAPDGARRWLRWRDQAEATLYLDGRPWHGFDVAHRFAPLPRGCREAWVHAVCVQSAIWHPAATGLDADGSRFDGAETVRRDEAAWSAYHDLLVLHELALEELRAVEPEAVADLARPGGRRDLTEASPLLRRLLHGLEAAADAHDWGGLPALTAALARLRRALRSAPGDPAAILTGHAHVDLVWLWPEAVGEAKAVHTFATVDRLMEEYPELRFGYSQPASYEAVARQAPGLMRRVRRRMEEGRWEATGALYVESDTLLAAGEPLLRSFQLGQEWFRANTGRPARTLWLPDVFGYAGCVPQLAGLSGVGSFFTNKLTWSRITPFPHSSFRWRGPDGSELVAHVSHEARQFYNGTATVRELRDGARTHRQSAVHPEFLVPTGYGDGGGGPTEEMAERARRMADLAGVPRARWGRVEDFFGRLARRRAELPVWTGEIYLEFHRGIYTTHGGLKAAFRAAERALQAQEAAHCTAGRGPVDAAAWRRLVFAQFHDAVTGSGVHEVYTEMRPELEEIARSAAQAAQATLGGAGGALFNPLSIGRTWRVPSADGGAGRLVLLPPLAVVRPMELPQVAVARVRVAPRVLDNGLVRAEFSADGTLSQLVVRGRPVALAGPGAQLVVAPDRPHAFDAWELDEAATRLGEPVGGRPVAAAAGDGTWCGQISFTRKWRGSRLATRYLLEAGSPVLRIEFDLDWREPQMLLKCAFPTGYRGQHARFGMPYGSVRRERWRGRPGAEAQWEVPGSRWAMVTDDAESEGLMLVTEAKYGFGGSEGGLDVSLLRTAMVTGEGGKQARAVPASLRAAGARPFWSDLGRHVIRLAVGRWRFDAPREEMPAALADTLFTAPLPVRGPARAAGLRGVRGGESLVPAWAKPLGRGRWLLRLHETLGRAGEAALELAPGWRARRAGVLDRPESILTGPLRFRGYEVVGVILERG